MNSGDNTNTLESRIDLDIPPLKKERRFLNSLVIKSALSMLFTWLNMSSNDPEILELLNEASVLLLYPCFFIAYLVLISIVESLALLALDTIKHFIK